MTEIDVDRHIFDHRPVRYRHLQQENGLGTNFIYKVYIDSRERTWFGSDGKGISVLDKQQLTNYQYAISPSVEGESPDSIPLKIVYSITEDHRGHIWLSTPEQGIFEFDGTHFHHLAVKDGDTGPVYYRPGDR